FLVRQSGGFYFDDCKVRLRVYADRLGDELAPVLQEDFDLGGFIYDVIVREDVAIGINDDAGTTGHFRTRRAAAGRTHVRLFLFTGRTKWAGRAAGSAEWTRRSSGSAGATEGAGAGTAGRAFMVTTAGVAGSAYPFALCHLNIHDCRRHGFDNAGEAFGKLWRHARGITGNFSAWSNNKRHCKACSEHDTRAHQTERWLHGWPLWHMSLDDVEPLARHDTASESGFARCSWVWKDGVKS